MSEESKWWRFVKFWRIVHYYFFNFNDSVSLIFLLQGCHQKCFSFVMNFFLSILVHVDGDWGGEGGVDIFLWKDICFWQCCNKHPPLHLLVLRFGWMFLLACCCWTTYTAPCFSPSPPLKPIRPPSPHRSSTQCVTEAILTQVLLFLRLDETRLRFSFRKVIGQLDMQLSYSWHTLKS